MSTVEERRPRLPFPLRASAPAARASALTGALTGPLALWLVALVAAPALIFLLYSFWTTEAFQIVRAWTLENYREVISDRLYVRALAGSLVIGAATAALSCAMAFVLAWAVRFHAHRWRDALVLVIVVASVGSYLARLYSWRSILGSRGLVNYVLESVGVIDEPLGFLLFNRFAVVVTLTNVFLPFAFLPIYANLLAIRPEVLQAGRVLGAGPIANFRRVILPLSSTGLLISFIYVFIFATGDFAAPTFLGGPTGVVAASLIAEQFGTVFNWPLGAALSFAYIAVLAAIVGVLTWATIRRTRRIAG